jgi:hypothetical protein
MFGISNGLSEGAGDAEGATEGRGLGLKLVVGTGTVVLSCLISPSRSEAKERGPAEAWSAPARLRRLLTATA